ncbi:hypothetical protein TNCV_1569421 [Trichonephila clavipes]|uniref:Uncharacterized protein n=1 Tax=Trichonephila clavipes TaxID=2585209 RepID=A0A8X6VE62_TRICX|nr:hypothetical protein TNCV_1569421 [Trichonephila clavipes]
MRARAYYVYPSMRDHWALRSMSRNPDQVVSLKQDHQCLSPQESFFGTYLSTHCKYLMKNIKTVALLSLKSLHGHKPEPAHQTTVPGICPSSPEDEQEKAEAGSRPPTYQSYTSFLGTMKKQKFVPTRRSHSSHFMAFAGHCERVVSWTSSLFVRRHRLIPNGSHLIYQLVIFSFFLNAQVYKHRPTTLALNLLHCGDRGSLIICVPMVSRSVSPSQIHLNSVEGINFRMAQDREDQGDHNSTCHLISGLVLRYTQRSVLCSFPLGEEPLGWKTD